MKKDKTKYVSSGGLCGGTYFFAVVGSAIYFTQNAASFGDGFFGLIKALFWPAVLVYEALKTLGA